MHVVEVAEREQHIPLLLEIEEAEVCCSSPMPAVLPPSPPPPAAGAAAGAVRLADSTAAAVREAVKDGAGEHTRRVSLATRAQGAGARGGREAIQSKLTLEGAQTAARLEVDLDGQHARHSAYANGAAVYDVVYITGCLDAIFFEQPARIENRKAVVSESSIFTMTLRTALGRDGEAAVDRLDAPAKALLADAKVRVARIPHGRPCRVAQELLMRSYKHAAVLGQTAVKITVSATDLQKPSAQMWLADQLIAALQPVPHFQPSYSTLRLEEDVEGAAALGLRGQCALTSAVLAAGAPSSDYGHHPPPHTPTHTA